MKSFSIKAYVFGGFLLAAFAIAAVMPTSRQLALGQPPAQQPRGARPHMTHCLISLIADVHVPAQEAGLLLDLPVIEGSQVRKDEVLGTIDDRLAVTQRLAAKTKRDAARKQATDDIEVRYAEAAYLVAEAEHEAAVEVNRRQPGTVPLIEVRRLELTQHRAALQIDKSKLDREVAGMNADVHDAEVQAADEHIERRRIRSPVDGVVVALFRQQGEWVNPGDPVARIAGMERLRVEGFLNASEFDPHEIEGRPVTVDVELAHGRTAKFRGAVTFVSPLVQAGGKYRVRAEVTNRRDGDHWILRPGMSATMTIE